MNPFFNQEFDSNDEDEEYIPESDSLSSKHGEEEIDKKETDKDKIKSILETLKNQDNPLNDKTEISIKDNENQGDKVEKEILDALNKFKEKQSKSKIVEEVRYGGQKFTYLKETTETDLKREKDKERRQTHKGLDQIIDSIPKKKEISVIGKSKKDWNVYVNDKNLEKELSFHRKDGYLNKKRFLEESNQKEYENQKEALNKKLKGKHNN